MEDAEHAHARDAEEVARSLSVQMESGLSSGEAARRRAAYGANAMPAEEPTPLWRLLLRQLDDPLVKILLCSAAVSFASAASQGQHLSTSLLEPSVILSILAANAAVGVATESSAHSSLSSLQRLQPDRATALRNSHPTVVPASDLVPGDVISLSVGDRVPADCRLASVASRELCCDQALLTGESASVRKSPEPIDTSSGDLLVQDKHNILFSGTTITRGRARCIIIATGSHTAIGRIRDSIAESANEMTPLKRKLDDFGAFLSKLIAAICIAVWVVSVGRFSDPVHGGFFRGAVHYFKTSVALAVAAIPEGLPAVVTTCLALGTRKMAKRNAIVRSLPSVETLGCVSAICSDKTGTLTTNQVSVRNILTLSSSSQVGGGQVQSYSVTGSTFEPSGTVRDSYGRDINHPCDNRTLSTVAQCCCLCNDSELTYSSEKKQFDHIGESTEVALLVLAEKLSLPSDSPPQSSGHSASKAHNANASRKFWESRFHKQLTLDFTRDRKMMSTLCTTSHWAAARRFESDTNDKDEQASIVFTKGAAERVLERCTSALCDRTGKEMALNDAHRNALVDALSDKSEHGMRLLALAYKRYSTVREEISEKDECDMVFAGAVAMHDPPREEVSDAIQTCRAAGIRTIVVTGDNLITAESICKQIGALDSGESARECGRALTGSEFEKFDTDAQQRAAAQVALFARVEPQHKQELVAALKRRGEIVAMTGDGVNDAPALKKADIGVAMGSGTAVARYASDMVLADDNFLTIVSAVKEGRAIYNNTKQFIRYMVSSNIGEVVCIFIAALLQMPEPLIPVQLLWVNLVTDGLPATALGFNMPDSDVMKQKPRATQAPIVDRWLLIRYFAVGVYVGIATIAGFVWWFTSFEGGPQLSLTQLMSARHCSQDESGNAVVRCSSLERKEPLTVAMSVLVVVEMFNALNALSENVSLLRLPPWSNKLLLIAIVVSLALHALILYSTPLASLFSVAPLGWKEWRVVLELSAGVVPLDEVLKLVSRHGKPRVSVPTGASFLQTNGHAKR